jgi:hypothetical protein
MTWEETTQTTCLRFKTQGSTKQDLLKGIRRIGGGGGGGGGDGGPDIIPQLLHQSNSNNKFISWIAKKLIAIEYVTAMKNKAEHQNNLLESVILRSTK